MDYKIIENGSVTTPKGYKAGAVYCAIKSKKSEKPDLTILISEEEATCAAVFTKNLFCAAPIVLGRETLKKKKARGVVINSGNANAATGELGMENARKIQKKAEELLNFGEDELFVSSTGVIGQQLPVDKILNGIEKIIPKLSEDGGTEAAHAIMTTDLVKKETALELELDGGTVKIGAMAKGSGMIHPNMATMLGYITTDAKVDADLFQKILSDATDISFNMLTVDGDTSTNDSLFAFANGASGVSVESESDKEKFKKAIFDICIDMAKRIAADGEGASHMLTVNAINLQTYEDARKVAKSIAGSTLFKAALFGKDANWGRIMAAAGYSGANLDISKSDCYLISDAGKIAVMKDGFGTDFDEDKALKILSEHDITVLVDFHDGECEATAWGCDLTYDYVKINGDYRS